MKPRHAWAMVGGAMAWLVAAHAWTANRDPAAADALFQAGRRLADAGDFAAACPKFAESQRLDPAPGTLLNLADCEEKNGRIARAAGHFKSAIELLPERDERGPIARKRLASLEPRVPRLTIRAAESLPPGSKVLRDGDELGSASLGVALPMDPGEHTISLVIPGQDPRTRTVVLREREHRQVDLEALASAAAGVTTPETPDAPGTTVPSVGAGGRRTLGYVIGGVGVASVGAAIVSGLMVQDRKNTFDEHCTDGRCDQEGLNAADSGKTLLTINTITWAVGIAGLGVGAYLVVTGGDTATAAASRAGVRPNPGGASLVWQGTW